MSHSATLADNQPLALYIHWPFCLSKCPYCDFNSHVREKIDAAAWCCGLLTELRHYAALLPERRLTSIFFGGGTPSLMAPETVGALIAEARSLWDSADDLEITLEANPTSVEAEKFAALRDTGVNRVSLGVQSLDETALRFLGRQHSAEQAQDAIALATKIFPRYSFDLIYARAGQTLAGWEQELSAALPLARGHLSLYQLTIEENTAFHTRAGRGEALTCDDATATAMFGLTQDIMTDAGLPAYEISNHAAPGQESRHNLTYWQYGDYVGIGPGAHGRFVGTDGRRVATVGRKVPEVWLRQVQERGHGALDPTVIDAATAQREALLMGLRLTAGIALPRWQGLFGQSFMDFLPTPKLQKLLNEGLLQLTHDALFATADGRQRLNAVLRYLLP